MVGWELTVNASRPPEHWQSYDVVFHAAQCDADNNVVKPGTMTILQNGVLIQDNVELKGPTPGGFNEDVCTPGSLLLQDHNLDVKDTFMLFRNIWYRPLPPLRSTSQAGNGPGACPVPSRRGPIAPRASRPRGPARWRRS